MRWFCLDPALPENATLRIRTAPNSDAATCGSVVNGKAIAVCAPEFAVADAQLQQTLAASSTLQRWLHVVFPDEFTGAAREGYMMASTPDGMRLMVPWEYAEFINCCRVGNKKAALFDGPSQTAHAVGLIEDGEGVRYPYGVSAASGSRARIYHNVHGSVWIEIAELEPVCVRLRHTNCSTAHAFYALNSELPPEAQIAIRSFPSKESETVGLLSRGEVIEVVARCGDWLQVLSAETGDQESWIMWKTDSWTLLVELAQSSERCTRATDVGERAPMSPRSQELSGDADSAELSVNGSHSHAPANEGTDSVVADADSVNSLAAMPNEASTSDDKDMELQNDHVQHADADSEGIDSSNDAITGEEASNMEHEDVNASDNLEELCEGMASSDLSVRHTDEIAHESAPAVNSWDERPLNVKHRQDTEGQQPAPVASGEEKSEIPVATHSNESLSEDATEMEVDQKHPLDQGDSSPSGREEAAASSIASWDDRPIRPQQNAWSWDDALPAEDQVKQQLQHTSADSEQQGEHALNQSSQFDGTPPPQSGDEEVNDTVTHVDTMTLDNSSWDDRPIRPQREPFKFELDDAEEDDNVGADEPPEDGSAELDSDRVAHDVTDTTTTGSNSAWDDRPIRPQREPFKIDAEEVDQVDTDVPSESGGRDDSSWEDRPIRPQREPFKFEMDGAEEVGSADTQMPPDDGAVELDIDGAAREPTEMQQSSASVYSWDERPIGSSAKTGLKIEHIEDEMEMEPMSVDSETDPDGSQVKGVKSFSSWNETPVGSKRRPHSVPKSPETAENVEDQLVEESPSTQHVSSWDETPVGPARTPVMPIELPVGCQVDCAADADFNSEASREYTREVAPADVTSRPLEEQYLNFHSEVVQNATEKGELDAESASGHRTEDDQVGQDMGLEVTSAHDELHDELHDDSDSPLSDRAAQSNDDVDSGEPMCHEPVGAESMEVEDDEIFASRDARMSDGMDDEVVAVYDYNAPSPVYEEMPNGSTQHSVEDMSMNFRRQDTTTHHVLELDTRTRASVQDRDQTNGEEFKPSQHLSNDMEVPADREMYTHAQQERTMDLRSRTKLDTSFGKSSKDEEKLSPTPRVITYEHRFGMAELTRAERKSGSLSFLLEFGIRAYCRHKQIMITSNDEISQILYQAVVFGDDPEVILETLVADDPPSQDWIAYSPSKVLSRASETNPHGFLDVLYARDSGEPPSTPKQLQPQQVHHLSTPPHPSGRRKEQMDSMFNRTPVEQRATPTFDLIMNNADVDKILEAEFGDEVCELAILGPYKYPTLSGRRLPGSAARSAMGDYGASTSAYNRLSNPSQPVGVTAAARRDEEAQETPGAASANPLKRAASAITRTPPVHVAKAASPAPPVIPVVHTEAERPKVPSTLPPPASRFGAKPPTMAIGASSSLRRLPSQPNGTIASSASTSESTVPRARSSQSLLSEPSATTSRISVTGTLPRPGQSLLQRKSFLPTPSPSTSVASTVNRNSIAGSIAQATDTSSMQARRASFGFVRPKTVIPKK
ncbi:hypothetical protein FI667_g12461, partial [Globisporangium splendens]